jgi:hypothetical protein
MSWGIQKQKRREDHYYSRPRVSLPPSLPAIYKYARPVASILLPPSIAPPSPACLSPPESRLKDAYAAGETNHGRRWRGGRVRRGPGHRGAARHAMGFLRRQVIHHTPVRLFWISSSYFYYYHHLPICERCSRNRCGETKIDSWSRPLWQNRSNSARKISKTQIRSIPAETAAGFELY